MSYFFEYLFIHGGEDDLETQDDATVIIPNEWFDQVIHSFIAQCAKPFSLDFLMDFLGKLVVFSRRLFQ